MTEASLQGRDAEVSSRTAGAAGFCFSVSSHAEGVVAGCALYVVSGRAQPLEFLSHVLEIVFTDFRFENFFDDWHEVG